MSKKVLVDLNLLLICVDAETGYEFPVVYYRALKGQDGSFVAFWVMTAPNPDEVNPETIEEREFANVFDKHGMPVNEGIDFRIKNA